MRTTLNIDDDIIKKATKLTGVKEKTSLVRLGLEALIARENARRLAELGGTEKTLKPVPRRRTSRKEAYDTCRYFNLDIPFQRKQFSSQEIIAG